MKKQKQFFPNVNPLTFERASGTVLSRSNSIESFITAMDKAKKANFTKLPKSLEPEKFLKTIQSLEKGWDVDKLMKYDLYNLAQLESKEKRTLLARHEVTLKRAKLEKEMKVGQDKSNPLDNMVEQKRLNNALDTYQKCIENIFNGVKERLDMVYPNKAELKKATIKAWGSELNFEDAAKSEEELLEDVQNV